MWRTWIAVADRGFEEEEVEVRRVVRAEGSGAWGVDVSTVGIVSC